MRANSDRAFNPSAIASQCSVELFVSYAHEDNKYKTDLVRHLSVLERDDLISIWYDRKIGPGDEWVGQIDCHLNTASIILLLLSKAFLSSRYCRDIEVKRALERHQSGEARVIPVIVRPVEWKADRELSKLQVLPTNARPVVKWKIQDEAYVDITRGILRIIKELTADQSLPVSATSLPARSTHEQTEGELEGEQDNGYVYDIGTIEPRFPSLGVEKEFIQASARHHKAGSNDREAMYATLVDPRYRYLVREMGWVLTKGGLDACLLVPVDPNDWRLLVESLCSEASPNRLDLVIGVRGGIELLGSTRLPIVNVDQIYSMDVESILDAIPLPVGTKGPAFRRVAEALLTSLVTAAQKGCGNDEDRALAYLAVRYAAIYTLTGRTAERGLRLGAVEVSIPPVSSEGRRTVNVFFSFSGRKIVEGERYLVAVDVTEKYPFLLSRLSRC